MAQRLHPESRSPVNSSTSEGSFATVWPLGRSASPAHGLAPRLASVKGRRIAFVWDHVFRGDDMFAAFSADPSIAGHVETVGHTAFGNIHGNPAEEREAVSLLPERLRRLGVDAVIVGVGA